MEAEPLESAAELIPPEPTLDDLRRAAVPCTACELHRDATQTVFGEGRGGALVMLVGEQPGDREDRRGRPFVGPSGRLLERSLRDAGLARGDVCLTNVVKHFRFEQRGKRRIHRKPTLVHMRACRPSLDAEIQVVAHKVLICLGATAARAIIGPDFRVSEQRDLRVVAETVGR